ncbi:Crp/Fnr family transcriptional regulator [Sulfitobacter sp. HNIBRBA3233]|uniref:Crp/Fnr family transcriptional regulator n=1 Tax=Sulfitobacter marinivivus TaxID=3158558 RepID=UPI0032DE799C
MAQASLGDIGFLSSASAALRNMIEERATRRHLAAGETLFSQGDPGDTLFAIASGLVEVSVLSKSGQKLGLDMMGAGELIGEIALFSPGPRTATITAIEPTEVWGLRNADVLDALQEKPELCVDLIELAGKRMRWMSTQYHEQVFMDAPTRLARRIVHYCGIGGSELRMSHADLASFVGTTRETVSKTLAGWKREGVISMGRSTITVVDMDALRDIAGN